MVSKFANLTTCKGVNIFCAHRKRRLFVNILSSTWTSRTYPSSPTRRASQSPTNQPGRLIAEDWCRWDWAAPYRQDVPDLHEPVKLVVNGKLPSSLKGVYYRNGPAKFWIGGVRVAHPFDGDGAVCRIQFDGSQEAELLVRYVKTDEFVAETASQRQMARGSFGTNIEGGQLANALDIVPKNTANISVLPIAGRLFALFEGGQPYEIDPDTLETFHCSSINGLLRKGAPFAIKGELGVMAEGILGNLRCVRNREPSRVALGGDALASHYRNDPIRQRIVCMSYQIEVDVTASIVPQLTTHMRFYEFADSKESLQLLTVKNIKLPGYAFVHDFAITDDSIIVMLNPLTLNLNDFIRGKLSPIHCLQYHGSKCMQVYLMPRKLDAEPSSSADIAEAVFGWPCETSKRGGDRESDRIDVFSLRPHFVQHIANAWNEESSGGKKLHLQYVGYPEMPDFAALSGPGHDYEQINPDCQPPSRLMHAIFYIPHAEGSPLAAAEQAGHTHITPEAVLTVDMGQAESSECCTHSSFSNSGTSDDLYRLEGLQTRLPSSVKLPTFGITHLVCKRVLEFPRINPTFSAQASRYVFGACSIHEHKNRPQQAIGVYDDLTGECKIWSRGWRYYVGEPEVIPSLPQHRRKTIPAELDGWILCICYDAERDVSEVVVLDAANVSQGPVATIDLPFVMPHGLHGAFVQETEPGRSAEAFV